jgi:hypothetical protein
MPTVLLTIVVVLVFAAAAAGTFAERTNRELRRTLARYDD